jgi:hypothetical protein
MKAPPFFTAIYSHISNILHQFRTMQHNYLHDQPTGLTAGQIGLVMEKIEEPWPDTLVEEAIQYQLHKVEGVDFPIDEIRTEKFANLDAAKRDHLFAGSNE